MAKILGSWSKMRKYLECEMIADCLRGRVRYGCTTYKGMDDCKVFEVCIDNEQIKRFSPETVNTYFINNGYKENDDFYGKREYREDFFIILSKTPMESRTEYTDEEFCDALEKYRNQDVQISINSKNSIVRMFAVLDRRIGKRTLERISGDLTSEPQWLQQFFRLRLEAESLGAKV